MMGHHIGFKEVIWKIIPKLSLLPLFIWHTVNSQREKYRNSMVLIQMLVSGIMLACTFGCFYLNFLCDKQMQV